MIGGRDSETEPEWRDDAEADKLRDEAFRRLLDVPPKPRKEAEAGKGRQPAVAGEARPAAPQPESAAD